MIIDAAIMAAVVAELQSCVPGKIQQVVQPTPDSLGFEIYAHGQRRYVLMSAHAQHARLHFVPQKPTRGPGADSPLLLLLRKYVRGARLTKIECPPLERFVTLSITKFPPSRNQTDEADEKDDEPVAEPFYSEIVLEILGRSSNIIFMRDDGIILESVRQFRPERASRPILPRALYQPPALQDKRDPFIMTGNGVLNLEGATLVKGLVQTYRGISPLLARESVMRVLGSTDAIEATEAQADAIADYIKIFINGNEDYPSLAYDEDDTALAVAPYALQQYPLTKPMASMSEALTEAFANLDTQSNHAQFRESVMNIVQAWTKRVLTRAQHIESQLTKAADLEQLRWEGEMIYAYLHTIKPGQKELMLDTAVIALDEKLTGVENAQRRFREYEKSKSAIADLPQLLEQAQAQAEYGHDMIAMLQLAESHEEIQMLEQELIEQDIIKPSRKKQQRSSKAAKRGPLRVTSPDGWTIYVGRSAAQNEEVTFKIGRPEDWWFHARERTGGHVVVRMQAAEVPPATLQRAAQLAAYYSAARNDGAVEVDIAQRKHVRRIKGGPPGLVRYTAEQTVRVEPKQA